MLLFDRNENLIGTLNNETRPIKDDFHDEELNGANTFEFTIPNHIQYSDQVKVGHYILFQDRDGNFQMFEIMEVKDTKSDKFEKTVYCENIMVELNDEPIKDLRPNNTTAEFALGQILANTRWEVGSVASLGNHSTNFYDTNVMKSLAGILEVWGGEIRTRVEVAGTEITGKYIDILAQRGSVTKKQITNTKDIITIERTVDTTQIKTAMIGRGKGEELESGGFGRRITFSDINDGLDYVVDENARQLWGRVNPDESRRHMFGYFEDSQETDPAILKTKTEEALAKVVDPLISYKIDFFDLEAVGLDHEKVRLGDTVVVIDDDFKPALEITARVIRTKRSLTDFTKGFIILGNFLPRFTDDQRLDKIETAFNQKTGIWDQSTDFTGPVPTSWLDGQIDTLTNQLVASGEYQQTDPIEGQGLLFENNDVMSVSHGAIYIGPNTLAIASERDPISLDWNWRSWGSGQGFTADVLTAGSLVGGKVKFNLEEGTFLIGDSIIDYDIYFDGTTLALDLSNEGSQITTLVRGSEEYTQDLAQIDESARGYAEQEAIDEARKILGVTNHEVANQKHEESWSYSTFSDYRGIVFEISNDVHIGQVTVYANNSGEMNIELRDSNNTTVESKTFVVNAGDNHLFLDLLVRAEDGKTWQLVGSTELIDGVRAGIRQSSNMEYPYSSGSFNVISGIWNDNTTSFSWYNFYEIEIAGAGVQGQRDTKITQLSSEISQTASEFQISFTQQSERIDNIDDYIEGTESEDGLKTYFNFSAEGLLIGNTNVQDPFTLRITNTKMSFEEDGTEVAWLSLKSLFIRRARITENIHLGAHLLESRGTGDDQVTIVKWVGEVSE